MILRKATTADLPQFAPIFQAIVAAGETYAYPEDLSNAEIGGLWLEGPPGRCVMAVDSEGTVLGSARMGPNRPGRGAHIATASFMVAPAAQGRGIGRRLGEEAVRWAREKGYSGMQFNAVVETNRAAVHLWQSLGFAVMTTIPEAFAHPTLGRVGLHVMYQALPSGDADRVARTAGRQE
ncbi:GNAT family N-acetyltransferase [Deinococcus sp. AJ005]|uniref:GNAT family N-acetyltransferase n=1 Tax=Deinococcus sp. AJ005 TaxID=2652443 RepID=UPI00125CB5C5|nr:GNAT family N-acetyltransferase [Deinococcus sp. AJ005]QFP77112.1 GNAT family N-acetyltransferase [Deinococcus sp. AJ005]